MSKYAKTELVRHLHNRISSIHDIIIWEPGKLKSNEFTQLRKSLYDKKIRCDFVKNSIAKISLSKKGYSLKEDCFQGQTCLAYSAELEANKLASEMVQTSKSFPGILIKGGIIDSICMNFNEIEVIAAGPSKKEYVEMIGRLVLTQPSRLAAMLLSVGNALAACVSKKVTSFEANNT